MKKMTAKRLAELIHETARQTPPWNVYCSPWNEMPKDGRDWNIKVAKALLSKLEIKEKPCNP